MSNLLDQITDVRYKLQELRKEHGAEVEILKRKISTLNVELQATQMLVSQKIAQTVELLERVSRAERQNLRSQLPLPESEPSGSNSEPSRSGSENAEPQTLS